MAEKHFAAFAVLLGLTGPAGAGERLFDTHAEQDALGAELRALFAAEPGIIENALIPQPAEDPYADEKAADLAAITSEAARLFAPDAPGFGNPDAAAIWAIFVRPDCGECADAVRGLQLLVRVHDLRVSVFLLPTDPADTRPGLLKAAATQGDTAVLNVLDGVLHGRAEGAAPRGSDTTTGATNQAMFDRLGLDTTPSYVLPDMLIRGEMPGFVLERYIDR